MATENMICDNQHGNIITCSRNT